MLGALLLSAALDFTPVIQRFVRAFELEDRQAVADRGTEFRESFADAIEVYEQIRIRSTTVASVEPTNGGFQLLVEIDGTAQTAGRKSFVALPRWWYLELKSSGGGWQLASATTLEQHLAMNARAVPAELQETVSRPDVDPERFLILLARNAVDRGAEACALLQWTLETSRAMRLPKVEAVAYRMQSVVEMLAAHFAQAELDALQSIAIAEAIPDADRIADGLLSAGNTYFRMGRVEDAIAVMTRAGSFASESDDPRYAQRTLYMAGVFELRRGRLREVLAITDRLEELSLRYPTPRARLDAAMLSGVVHQAVGNYETARRQFEAALAAARLLADARAEAIALHNIGAITGHDGDAEGERALQHEAMKVGEKALYPTELVTIQLAFAKALWNLEDLDGVEQTLAAVIRTATAEDERSVLADAYALRADLRIAQGAIGEALRDAGHARMFCEAPEGTGRSKLDKSLSRVLTVEGRALRAAGRNGEAEEVWRAAIDVAEAELAVVEGSAGSEIVDRKFTPYRELIDLLMELGCARDALITAERMRARTLREVLRNGRVDLSAGLDAATREREAQLENALASANRALLSTDKAARLPSLTTARDEARLALRRFRTELYTSHVDLRSRRPETFDDYGVWEPRVEPGELVVAFTVTKNATFVFALHQGTHDVEITARTIPLKQEALEKRVRRFVTALAQRDFAYRDQATKLYELLLAPLAAHITNAQSIRVVPDGVLWRLPFHVLVDRTGKHLADRFPISYSPSLAGESRHRMKDRRTLFALGDPRVAGRTQAATRSLYHDVIFEPLTDAAVEVQQIAGLYREAHVRIAADADEETFKREAGAYDVLHLATHAIVDDRAPLFSSIVLATSNDPHSDGLLEAREIAGLKLNADIAVLSGCATATGKVTPGEGILGLSWAFLVAGVPRTVVSQWNVESRSTAALMTAFHGHLRSGATAADALQRAMLELRDDPRWRHPFYWAPFVVVEN